MSNLNDYEDKEIIIDDEKFADSNSNKKKAIFPWILTFAYEFDDIKVLIKGNRVKCKACGNLGAFCINDRTTNHINHITQTAPLKHAIMRENIKLNRTPSTKEINAMRKLDEMFEATSKTFLECFLNKIFYSIQFDLNSLCIKHVNYSSTTRVPTPYSSGSRSDLYHSHSSGSS
jgi:hypothetical protein